MKKTFLIIILGVAVIAGLYLFKNDSQNSASPDSQTGVTYTNSGYSPEVIRVKAGAAVKFVNQSQNPMWTASDPHPTHTMMHGFDSMHSMMTGESYSYTFTVPGTWRYHNHMVPSHAGSVIVE